MANFTILLACTLTVILFLACVCASAYGDENLPWGVERIRAYCVWDNNRDMTVDDGANAGQAVSIAVIDSGIDYYTDEWGNIHYHPDLSDNVAGGRGFRHWGCVVQERTDHEDFDGHGTHVAGTIAAVDNEIGVIGTAPKTKIYALRYFSHIQQEQALEVAAAINWSVDHGIHIISISLGFAENYSALYNACKNAYERGNLIIAAAGNENSSVCYPARYDCVIAVGAIYSNGARWEWSNFGPELELVAPGVNINSTWLNGGYALDNGTSMAVPHVTAAAALIWSSKIDPEYDFYGDGYWDNIEVRHKLRHLALDLGPTGKDDEYGYGLINAWATNQRPLGDINNDYKVDLKDLFAVAIAYGSYPGHPKWNPNCDINIDNLIDLKDYYIVSKNFGKVDP